MAKVKVSEASGRVLAWLVAEAEGLKTIMFEKNVAVMFPGAPRYVPFLPHTDWAHGGPIIERKGIGLFCNRTMEIGARFKPDAGSDWRAFAFNKHHEHYFGPTLLIAAMRCYVTSELGKEVEVPDELLK